MTMFIIFWDILIDEQTLFSPQVKRSMIVNNKHGIYDLSHKLPDDLRLVNYDLRIYGTA